MSKPRAVGLLSVCPTVNQSESRMPEIGTSGSMSENGKRSVAERPKLPRPFSTYQPQRIRVACARPSASRRVWEAD